MARIDAVLFDLDGVLVTTDEFHTQAWKRMATEEGLPFHDSWGDLVRGISRAESLERILEAARKEGAEFSYTDEEKKALTDRKNSYYQELITSLEPGDRLPGSTELLEALQDLGVRIGMFSSSRNSGTIVDAIDMRHYFDAVVTGHDITRPKPDPQGFLICAEACGAEPARCVVFEDAPAGIDAALNGGMLAVAIGRAELFGERNVPVVASVADVDAKTLVETGRPRKE